MSFIQKAFATAGLVLTSLTALAGPASALQTDLPDQGVAISEEAQAQLAQTPTSVFVYGEILQEDPPPRGEGLDIFSDGEKIGEIKTEGPSVTEDGVPRDGYFKSDDGTYYMDGEPLTALEQEAVDSVAFAMWEDNAVQWYQEGIEQCSAQFQDAVRANAEPGGLHACAMDNVETEHDLAKSDIIMGGLAASVAAGMACILTVAWAQSSNGRDPFNKSPTSAIAGRGPENGPGGPEGPGGPSVT